MKKSIVIPFLFFIIFHAYAHESSYTVNRVIGDISFAQKFKSCPGDATGEQLRIRTHLAFVENLLRQKDISVLTAQQQRNRLTALIHLHQYWIEGRFPVNEKYLGERRPCFIDSHGNICAVGYLVEKTAGRAAAENINSRYQYDYITDMNDLAIAKWADEFGLTMEECAMIQPAYQPTPADPYIPVVQHPVKTSQGITSSLIGGANAAIILTNLSGRARTINSRFAYAGLVTGTAQIIFGMATVKKERLNSFVNGPQYRDSYKAGNTLSYVNIATGAATVVTSLVNMGINRRSKCKKNAVNIYSYPDSNNRLTIGFSFVKAIG